MHMKKLATLLAVGGALTMAAPASAQQSVQDGYGGQGNVDQQVLGEVGTVSEAPQQESAPVQEQSAPVAQATPPAQQAEGTLPFTGLDAALIAFGGLLLVGLGVTVRRISRDPGTPA
jgi:hypothetical protein